MLPLTREGLREELSRFAREQLNEQLREQGFRTREEIRNFVAELAGSASGAQGAGPLAQNDLQQRLQQALNVASAGRRGSDEEALRQGDGESGDEHEWMTRHFNTFKVKEAGRSEIGPMIDGTSKRALKSNVLAAQKPPPAGYGLPTDNSFSSASTLNSQKDKVTTANSEPARRVAWNSDAAGLDGVEVIDASEDMVSPVHIPVIYSDEEKATSQNTRRPSNVSLYSVDTMDMVIPSVRSYNATSIAKGSEQEIDMSKADSRSSSRQTVKGVLSNSARLSAEISWSKEPADISRWRVLADEIICSYYFETVSGVAVILNAVSIGVETDYVARHETDDPPVPFRVIEMLFCIIFTSEILLRLYTHRCLFFTMQGKWWNMFDLLVVSLQLVEEFMNLIVTIWKTAEKGQKMPTNFSMLRVLRILRLIRIMRLIRVLRLIGELRTIVCSIAGSMKSLFWTVALLFMLIYLVAIYLTQLVADHKIGLQDSEGAPPVLSDYYGSLAISILSLFQSMTGGIDWENMVTPLINEISPMLGLIFSLYIAFAVLCLMNVVTGVFVEAALLSAKQDKDIYMVNHARDLFNTLDTDGSGQLSWKEFKEQLHNKDMQEYFQAIDVDPSEAKGLFKLLDINRNGKIDSEAFLSATFRLRGPAKALDLALLMHETRRMNQSYTAHAKLVEAYLTCLATVLPEGLPKSSQDFPPTER